MALRRSSISKPSGKVIQFLSYEGSFTATNGPAIGMISTDIGLAEASTAQWELPCN
jgi:hypothetical protein